MKVMAESYGYDISEPASNAKEAVQWLYFGYLGAIKDQNGAAMSLGRTSTFLDIYFETDLKLTDLPEELQEEAKTGISFSDISEVYSFLENYSS